MDEEGACQQGEVEVYHGEYNEHCWTGIEKDSPITGRVEASNSPHSIVYGLRSMENLCIFT
jgi:hypothetical protein